MELTPDTQAELTELAERFGAPLTIDATIDDRFDDPIRRKDRFGEVCMVIRRPNGKLLLSIKTFYPRGAYRLPTGGIEDGERVYDALLREGHEETGLELMVERFLARISYRGSSGAAPLFHTFAFLLRETGGTLGAIDTGEQIEDWREVETTELPAVADFLEHLASSGTRSIGGSWSAWGKFRAIAHRIIHEALMRPR
ncbi:MAG: NUDIX hydrolase [Chloroflexota bacterium]|nr:NUDIX hydrolase [Chloroflexota bacterium]